MARFAFGYSANESGLTVTLFRKALLRGSEPVPPERWADEMGEVAFAGVAHLLRCSMRTMVAQKGTALGLGSSILPLPHSQNPKRTA